MAFPVAHTTTGQLVTAAQISEWADNMNLLKTTSDTHTTTIALLHTPIASDGSVFGPLKGYHEVFQVTSIVAGVLRIDYTLGNHVFVTLNANIIGIAVDNYSGDANAMQPLVIYYVADGTARTVVHTINGFIARFPGGTQPVMTSTAGKVDSIVYLVAGSVVLSTIMAQNQ